MIVYCLIASLTLLPWSVTGDETTVPTTEASTATAKQEKIKLGDLKKKRAQNKKQKAELEKTKKEAQEYVKAVENQITVITKSIEETKVKAQKKNVEIKHNEKKLKKSTDNIRVQYKDMKKRIQYMYENGNTKILELMLESESFTDFLNKAEYISELSKYDKNMMEKLKKTRKQIIKTRDKLENDKEELKALEHVQKNDKIKLELLSKNKEQEIKSYTSLIKASEKNQKMLNEEINKQEDKIVEAEQRAIEEAKRIAQERAREAEQTVKQTRNKDIVKYKKKIEKKIGGYTWPVPGYTTISSDYGDSDGRAAPHNGVDIPAPTGTPIVAVASGTVILSALSNSAGNWVVISHDNGITSVYMHMSVRMVETGMTVNKGETIGLVGSTGQSTGPHLHIGVRSNGVYVSPWTILSR